MSENTQPEALGEAEYFIDNPSAWSSFDQRCSDAIQGLANEYRRLHAENEALKNQQYPPQTEAQVPAVPSTDDALLRRMLCAAHCGASAYMDDGEASDSSAHPGIDFLRDSPREIQRKIWERNRATLTAAPRQAAPAAGWCEGCTPDNCAGCIRVKRHV